MANALGSLHDNQKNSYEPNGIEPGETRQRVRISNSTGEEVPVTGAFQPSGLKNGGLITEVVLSDSTWTAIPATALTNRNALGFQNPNGVSVKVNFTQPAGFIGWEIAANGEFFIDITDAIVLYAKAQSGTPTITVMELS